MRRSSRGNPWHYPAGSPKGGQFAKKGTENVLTIEHAPDYYEAKNSNRLELICENKGNYSFFRSMDGNYVINANGPLGLNAFLDTDEYPSRHEEHALQYKIIVSDNEAKTYINGEYNKTYTREIAPKIWNAIERTGYDERRRTQKVKGTVQGQRRGTKADNGDRGKERINRRIGNGSGPVVRPYTNGLDFNKQLENARLKNKFGCCVDNHSPEELNQMKMFISDDKKSGIAVEKDGNICCAFNTNKEYQMVSTLLDVAKKNGGTKMDCYGKKLVNMYEENGFKAVARVPFNPDYIEKNDFNKPLLENKFDVYVMMLGKVDHRSEQRDLDNLPTFTDYDEALAYRDSMLND